MLASASKVLLTCTSLAPIAIVYGFTKLPDYPWNTVAWLGVAGLLVLVCRGLLAYAVRHVPPGWVDVTEIDVRDSDILAFLIAYALPLITQEQRRPQAYALGAVVVLVAIVLARCNLFHVNPLLGMLGFHFFSVKTTAGLKYLVISKRDTVQLGKLRVARLTPLLYIEVPKEVGHGSAPVRNGGAVDPGECDPTVAS